MCDFVVFAFACWIPPKKYTKSLLFTFRVRFADDLDCILSVLWFLLWVCIRFSARVQILCLIRLRARILHINLQGALHKFRHTEYKLSLLCSRLVGWVFLFSRSPLISSPLFFLLFWFLSCLECSFLLMFVHLADCFVLPFSTRAFSFYFLTLCSLFDSCFARSVMFWNDSLI